MTLVSFTVRYKKQEIFLKYQSREWISAFRTRRDLNREKEGAAIDASVDEPENTLADMWVEPTTLKLRWG